jgi:hypothetical protein
MKRTAVTAGSEEFSARPGAGQQIMATRRPRCPPFCFVGDLVMKAITGGAGIPFVSGLLVFLAGGVDSQSRPMVMADQLSRNPLWHSMAVASRGFRQRPS